MTPIVLPLAMSLVSLGMSEPVFTPTRDIPADFAGARLLPQLGTDARVEPVNAWTGSEYADTWDWQPDVNLQAQAGPAAADQPEKGPELAGGDRDNHDFDLTPGVGLVGVGFVWRYR